MYDWLENVDVRVLQQFYNAVTATPKGSQIVGFQVIYGAKPITKDEIKSFSDYMRKATKLWPANQSS